MHIDTVAREFMLAYVRARILGYILHTCIHTWIYTSYMHTYMHAYIHTYIHEQHLVSGRLRVGLTKHPKFTICSGRVDTYIQDRRK